MNRVIVIIEARCGSTRLPGKIMLRLAGKPVIWHIIERAKRIKNAEDVVVATTVSRKDDRLIAYLNKLGVKYFRGSEKDVLDRYIKTAAKFRANFVVRVCADSPLIDPKDADRMIERLLKKNADYVLLTPGVKCLHQGFEVASVAGLKKQLNFSDADYVKEHVSIYIREKPGLFKIAYYSPAKPFQRKWRKLSVDTFSDLRFMRRIYKKLYKPGEIVDLEKALKLIDKDPALAKHGLQKT